MTEPVRLRGYYQPVDKNAQSLPTCEPDPDLKPEPWLLPDFMFDDPEDETEPPQNKTKHTPDSGPYEKPVDHDQ